MPLRCPGAEERRASHILLTWPENEGPSDDAVRERARGLLAQARQNPAGFADLARQHSQDPGSGPAGGDLDYFSRGAMVKPFEDAVFALEKDAISDLVETEFGVHIIRLTDIKRPPQRSFESLRAELERDCASNRPSACLPSRPRTSATRSMSSRQPPAGGRLVQAPDPRAQGLLREPQPGAAGPLGNERLLSALFSNDAIERKRNTEAIETASGQLTSARIVNHRPARTLPLDEVRQQVRDRLVAQRAAELARSEGEKQLEAWRSNTAGQGPASPAVTISRDAPGDLPAEILAAALNAPTGTLPAWQGVSLGNAGYAVIKVEKVLPRQPRDDAAVARQERAVRAVWSAAEAQAYYDTLYSRFKVRILVPAPSGQATR
jgi:peptidyl-prolyl cis-trans isomerase D